MNCNEDNLSFKLEKFPNNGGQNETKNKNKILRKTGHCRIIYKNISNVTILSSSSQSVPNILECSITKQHVSRFTLCRPFFSLRIKQYIYIYIYLERLINPLDRFVSRMATERKNSITRVSNAIFVTVVAARVCPSSFLCPFECVYRIFVTDRASCRIRISGLFKGFPRSRACCWF